MFYCLVDFFVFWISIFMFIIPKNIVFSIFLFSLQLPRRKELFQNIFSYTASENGPVSVFRTAFPVFVFADPPEPEKRPRQQRRNLCSHFAVNTPNKGLSIIGFFASSTLFFSFLIFLNSDLRRANYAAIWHGRSLRAERHLAVDHEERLSLKRKGELFLLPAVSRPGNAT